MTKTPLTGARGRVQAEKARRAAAAKAARTPFKAAQAAPAPKAQGKAPAAPKAAKAAPAPQFRGWWADAAADAAKGKLPPPPDFSAATHTRFRAKLAALVDLAKAGDVAALQAIAISPGSTSPKAMDRYRNLAVVALTARP